MTEMTNNVMILINNDNDSNSNISMISNENNKY